MAKDRPSQANLQPPEDADMRVRVALLEQSLATFGENLKEHRAEMRREIIELGTHMSGLATKEEVRQVSDSIASLRSAFDRFIVRDHGESGGARKAVEATGKEDPTLKQVLWDGIYASAKLVVSGIIVALILLAVQSKFFSASGELPSIGGNNSDQPASNPPAPGAHSTRR